MSTTTTFILVALLGTAILFFALKFGTIGGAGVGARKDENPFLYWLGVSMTGVAVVVAIVMLVYVRPK